MKILFTRNTHSQDYLSDCILHGLRQLTDITVVDEPYCWYMYKSTFGEGKRDIKSIYGKGFTIFGTLNDLEVDRTDINNKILGKHFDYIILSRIDQFPNFVNLVFENYPPNKIVILDGLDYSNIDYRYVGKALYFKREMVHYNSKVFPISFGFPKEKIQKPLTKENLLAQYNPNSNKNYTYDNEQDYYNDYNKSYFGKTFRKAGFDCLRHYEILGSNCIPYFTDIDHCPKYTCINLPKDLLRVVTHLIDKKSMEYFMTNEGVEIYNILHEQIMNHFKSYGTTEAIAKQMLDKISEYQ